jgi:hypothetical protein
MRNQVGLTEAVIQPSFRGFGELRNARAIGEDASLCGADYLPLPRLKDQLAPEQNAHDNCPSSAKNDPALPS